MCLYVIPNSNSEVKGLQTCSCIISWGHHSFPLLTLYAYISSSIRPKSVYEGVGVDELFNWAFQALYATHAWKVPKITLKKPKNADSTSDKIAINKACLSDACLCIH